MDSTSSPETPSSSSSSPASSSETTLRDWFDNKTSSSSSASSLSSSNSSLPEYRAERVLANRSKRSRSECFVILQQRRLFEVVPYDPQEQERLKQQLELQRQREADRDRKRKKYGYVYNPKIHDDDDLNDKNVKPVNEELIVDDKDKIEWETFPFKHIVLGDYAATTATDFKDSHDNNNNNDNNNYNNTVMSSRYSEPRYFYWRAIPGPSHRIAMDSVLFVNKKEPVPPLPPLLMVYHKPKWVLSVRGDPKGRPCLDSQKVLPELHPVGRLDYDSSGLLLFSSKGALTQQLLHPKHAVTKEYVATVTGRVNFDQLEQQLAQGVVTAEGTHTAQLVSAEFMPSDQVTLYLQDVKDHLPPEYNVTDLSERGYLNFDNVSELSIVRLSVQEGKYRMVRRMLANCGHPVVNLHRDKLGVVELGDNVPPGAWRALTTTELQWAESLLGERRRKGLSPNTLKVRQRRLEKKAREEQVLQEQGAKSSANDKRKKRLEASLDKKKRKPPPKKSRREIEGDANVDYVNGLVEEMEQKMKKRQWRQLKKKGLIDKDDDGSMYF
ncbi:hypothetical protein ACA910_012310 [Epithemia clementina (nom. ined.)]